MTLVKQFVGGTHRAVPPEVTLSRITPHLGRFGITRLADVTGLDQLGISTYCAIRPGSKTVQVSNGKGLRPVDAQVSGLMEAIELHYAENPAVRFCRVSQRQLADMRAPFVAPATLPGYQPHLLLDEHSRIEWVEGVALPSGDPILVPASVAYVLPRSLYRWSSNGLASGNHLVEATLHALYEVIERHTLSQLVDGEELAFERAQVIDVDSITDHAVAQLVARIRAAGLTVQLLRPPVDHAVHTFMAVLCDTEPFGLRARVDPGYGAHLSPSVAALRALTEAAQGRLTVIHGSREDVRETTYLDDTQERLYRFFAGLEPERRWDEVAVDGSRHDLDEDHATVLAAARAAGLPELYRVELRTREALAQIAVVKVIAPGALDCFPL